MNTNVHAIINLKQEIVKTLELGEIFRGRTKISRYTRMNWNYHANRLIHGK